jgi:hypothetical protein
MHRPGSEYSIAPALCLAFLYRPWASTSGPSPCAPCSPQEAVVRDNLVPLLVIPSIYAPTVRRSTLRSADFSRITDSLPVPRLTWLCALQIGIVDEHCLREGE